MKRSYAIGFIILVMTVAVGYNLFVLIRKDFSSRASKYGMNFNSERIRKGIPPIKMDWKAQEIENDYIIWGDDNPVLATTKPMHYYKETRFEGRLIRSERDIFHYETDGESAYRLSCNYSFESDSVTFSFIKYHKNSYPPTDNFIVDKTFADSVLHQWNFKEYYIKE